MPTRTIEWAGQPRKFLADAEKVTAKRIIQAMKRFVDTGLGDVRKLRGVDGSFRLRVGDYRVIFALVPDGVLVEKIGHRRDVYE